MIVNIRGTSGSGKSHLVRRIMELYTDKNPLFIPGRKQPIKYQLHADEPGVKDLHVIGHYETACGGCDTISKMDDIFAQVRGADDLGQDVMFEGLLIAADVNRVAELHKEGRQVLVLALDTTLETCLSSVNQRRMERLGPEKYTPVKEANTISKHRGVQRSVERLLNQEIEALWGGRDELFEIAKLALGWT